jgi:hypothetical protein
MVVRLHRRTVAEQRAHSAAGVQRHLVLGELAGDLLVLLVADDLG